MMILNLGAGKKRYPGAINVDLDPDRGDMVVDLSQFPWPWEDNSIDMIHASHIMEHIQDQDGFRRECLRVLKSGGYLRIVAPHSSCVTSIGHLGHYRTYCFNAFNDYMYGFKTVDQTLRWWYEAPDEEGNVPKGMLPLIKFIDIVMNIFIALVGERVFENIFCPTIQCREVIWEGVKL